MKKFMTKKGAVLLGVLVVAVVAAVAGYAYFTSTGTGTGATSVGTVTDWNRGAEAVFGYTAAEVIGKSLSLLLSEGQQDEALHIMLSLIHI